MQVMSSNAGFTTPKNILGLSALFLVLAVVFGVLNGQKVKTLRENVATADAARDAAETKRVAAEKTAKEEKAAAAATAIKATELEAKAASIQSELTQAQAAKTDLETKLQAAQAEVASVQRKVEEAGAHPDGANPGAASPNEMQAQLDEARRQLENAERENAFLSDRIKNLQETSVKVEEQRKRGRATATRGVRGVVLAVNQAYNFVVLNLGGRNGVEPNSEMLVVREGNVIGKLKISSVEPSTAIGDIITSSMDRGVQVQPGDTVVYAGSNS